MAADDSSYGLNASIWGPAAQARRLARRLHVGTVNVNEGYAAAWASHAAPMGGTRDSGMGRRHGAGGAAHLDRAADRRGAAAAAGHLPAGLRSRPLRALDDRGDPGAAPGADPVSPADGARRAHGPVEDTHWDVVVVGSGFGGSVAALRLVEKGYRVLVLEAGRRFADDELPRSSWDLRRFLWAPRLGWLGIQRVHVLRNVVVLAGAGVGGGSLVYANTLYRPPAEFYDDPQWADLADWRGGARAALRHRRTDARRGDQPDHHRRGPRDAAGRQADGRRATPSVPPRSGCSSAATGAPSPASTYRTRTSAGPARLAPGAPSAARA